MANRICEKCGKDLSITLFHQTDKILCSGCFNSTRGLYFIVISIKEVHKNTAYTTSTIMSILEKNITDISSILEQFRITYNTNDSILNLVSISKL